MASKERDIQRILWITFAVLLLVSPTGAHPRQLLEDEDIPSWWTPFHRAHKVDTLSLPKCRGVAPGFDPDVIAIRDAIPPIRTLDDLQRLKPEQKVLVVAPRFGLGNTLRNWVSAYFFALFSGRRIVLLHGGKFHGVYTSLCNAFKCAFDHIVTSEGDRESVALLSDYFNMFPERRSPGLHNAREGIYWDDPMLFSFSYAFWDHWWTNNRTLAPCGCAAVGNCHGGGGFRGAALRALVLEGGPSEALDLTIQEVLRFRRPDFSDYALPLDPSAKQRTMEQNPALDLTIQFDVGLHMRTRVGVLERPGRPYGRCRKEECEKLRAEEEEAHRAIFFHPSIWDCIHNFLSSFAGMRNSNYVNEPLSIFLGTDNVRMRDEFVSRLTKYGTVYFNNGSVAHVGVSGLQDKGRLPTLAEFYLLGKSQVVVEVDNYMSTFAQFAATIGNGSLVGLPRRNIRDPTSCRRGGAGMVGVWRKTDPRRVSNKYFKIER